MENMEINNNSSNRRSDGEPPRRIIWTEEEHRSFLLGLEKYGKGDWRSISRYCGISKTPTQVASHAQKHFIRLNQMERENRSTRSVLNASGEVAVLANQAQLLFNYLHVLGDTSAIPVLSMFLTKLLTEDLPRLFVLTDTESSSQNPGGSELLWPAVITSVVAVLIALNVGGSGLFNPYIGFLFFLIIMLVLVFLTYKVGWLVRFFLYLAI